MLLAAVAPPRTLDPISHAVSTIDGDSTYEERATAALTLLRTYEADPFRKLHPTLSDARAVRAYIRGLCREYQTRGLTMLGNASE